MLPNNSKVSRHSKMANENIFCPILPRRDHCAKKQNLEGIFGWTALESNVYTAQ